MMDNHEIFMESSRLLNAKTRKALGSVYNLVQAAHKLANQTDADKARKELAEFELATYEALNVGGSHKQVLANFARTVRDYDIEPEVVVALFKGLSLDTTNTTFSLGEYRTYIAGLGEASALMVLRILCGGRADRYRKQMSSARALGAAICKVTLLLEHGETHKRHGRMYFPEVSKQTFNQARLAEVLMDIEADFRKARTGIGKMPAGTRTAVAVVFVYYYDILRRMRTLTPEQIDQGMAKPGKWRKYLLITRTYVSPALTIHRGKL